jgi:hypothetical protein
MNSVPRRRPGHSATTASLASYVARPGGSATSSAAFIGSMIVGAGLVDMVVFADLIAREIIRGAVLNEASLSRICVAGMCFISAIAGGAFLMRNAKPR